MKRKDDLIDARKLKKLLSNKSEFSSWIRRNVANNNLIENKDFFLEKEKIKLLERTTTKTNYLFTMQAMEKIILNSPKNKIAKRIKEELKSGKELDKILKQIIMEKETEIKIIKFDDKDYPEQLKTIKNPPRQIYVKGRIENLKENGIAVIGTRDCSIYGRKACRIFTNNLVGYNLNIISGLATGIDGCAHKASIEAHGKTIAVLPSGFKKIYPKENKPLLDKILENGGTVITEYPPEFEKTQESCRERNRIMSGLAIGTLVIEAEKRSGTSITVRYTNEQNKKAFCIPSSLLNSKGIGTNKMIKENKAKLVTDVEDIIKEFPELKLKRKEDFNFIKIGNQQHNKKSEKVSRVNIKIEKENVDIYNFLTKEPKEINEIAKNLNEPISEIAYKLTLLELQGVIEELPGKKFKIK